jgi:hypothetical protein
MPSKEDLVQFAADAATNPKAVVAVSTATSGIGLSTAIGWLEKGIGVAASAAGLLLALMMVRKVILESAKLKLELDALSKNDED